MFGNRERQTKSWKKVPTHQIPFCIVMSRKVAPARLSGYIIIVVRLRHPKAVTSCRRRNPPSCLQLSSIVIIVISPGGDVSLFWNRMWGNWNRMRGDWNRMRGDWNRMRGDWNRMRGGDIAWINRMRCVVTVAGCFQVRCPHLKRSNRKESDSHFQSNFNKAAFSQSSPTTHFLWSFHEVPHQIRQIFDLHISFTTFLSQLLHHSFSKCTFVLALF